MPPLDFRVEQRGRIPVVGDVSADGVTRGSRQPPGLREQQGQGAQPQHAEDEACTPPAAPAGSRLSVRTPGAAASHDTGSKRTPPNASQAASRVSTMLKVWPTT